MRTWLKMMAIAGVTLTWMGCADVASTDVLTSGVYANLSVTATGDGSSKASAILRVGGPFSMTFLDLEGDDELVATVGEDALVLQEAQLGSIHSYSATLDMDTPGQEVVIAFDRTLDAGAPNSVMALPPAFALAEMADEFERSQGFTLTWEPVEAAFDMSVDIDGSCIDPFSESLGSDTGSYTLLPNALELSDDESEDNCSVSLTVKRSLEGTVDEGYGEGGTAMGYQVRYLQALSQP